MGQFTTVLAYLGPETMLPMTSVVAGVMGVLMMFGRSSVRWSSAAVRRLTSKSRPAAHVRKIGMGPVGGVGTQETSRAEAQG